MKTKQKIEKRPEKNKSGGPSKYKSSMCFMIHDLARSGHSETEIAQALGVGRNTLAQWRNEKKMVALALSEGRAAYDREIGAKSFAGFVVGTLPEDLLPLWEELIESQNDPSAIRRLDKLIDSHGRKARMRLFLHALVLCDFNVGKACTMCNVGYDTFYHWKRQDLDFARLVEEIIERKKDFFEGALIRLVKQGIPAAVIHANKTFNADRGYSTKVEVTHSGNVNVSLTTIPVSQLALSIEDKKRLLHAIREMKQSQIDAERTKAIPARVEVVEPTNA